MDETRLEAASAWRLRQEAGLTPEESARFQLWISDPANASAYAQADFAWGAFDQPDSLDLARLRAETRGRVGRRRAMANIGRIAAGVAVIAGGAGIYAAQAGKTWRNDGVAPITVALEDGSRLTLDARSAVRVRYDAGQRQFELREGQAAFQVFHDPSRPFRVKIDRTTVTALGTTFNINRWGEGATITLIEGAVQVDANSWTGGDPQDTRLAPGQQVTVQEGKLSAVARVETSDVTAWRDGDLVFSDVSLDQAVAGVNRYGGAPVRLASADLGRLRVSGVFRAGDTATFAHSVARLHGLGRVAKPDEITLQAPE